MNNNNITVAIKGTSYQLLPGSTVGDAINMVPELDSSKVMAAIVNHSLRELSYVLPGDARIELLGMDCEDGLRIYRRTLLLVLIKSIHDLYPETQLIVHHSLSNGLYCELRNAGTIDQNTIQSIKSRMEEYIRQQVPIIKHTLPDKEAVELFRTSKQLDKVRLLQFRSQPQVNVYELAGYFDYF